MKTPVTINTLSNLSEDLKEILNCEEKIKSLTSALQCINAQRKIFENLFLEIQKARLEASHDTV